MIKANEVLNILKYGGDPNPGRKDLQSVKGSKDRGSASMTALYEDNKYNEAYGKNIGMYPNVLPDLEVYPEDAPQHNIDRRKAERSYSTEQFAKEYLPNWSEAISRGPANLPPSAQKEYDKRINDQVVEEIFKRRPTFDMDYSNDRVGTLKNFSDEELDLIKNSSYAHKIQPSIWNKFEQGALSLGNAGSPVQLKNENLTKEEFAQENTPLNLLQPIEIGSKLVQSAYKDGYTVQDALRGKQNNASVAEDILTDLTNFTGAGLLKASRLPSQLFNRGKSLASNVGKNLPSSGVASSVDDVVDLYRIQERNAKTFQQLADEGKLHKAFNNPQTLARKAEEEKYFGQWFTKDKKDLDFYKADREFLDPEIVNLRVPKSELSKYSNYDKSLSRSPDREFVIPLEEQKRYLNPSSVDDAGKYLAQAQQTFKGAFFDHLNGLNKGILNPSRYPLTALGKSKLMKEQDNALKKAENFIEEWNFNADGTINNSVKQRMKNLTDDEKTREALDSYNRKDNSIYNPMEKPNKLVSSRRKDLEKAGISHDDKEYITTARGKIGGVNTSDNSITLRNQGNYYNKPEKIAGTVVHESTHSAQNLGWIHDFKTDTWVEPWSMGTTKFNKDYNYFTSNKKTEVGQEFAKHMVEPKAVSPGSRYDYKTWLSSPMELHSELMTARYNLVEKLSKNQTKEARGSIINRLRDNPTDNDIDLLLKEDLNKFFKPSTSIEDKRKLIRMLPALAPAAIGTGALSQHNKNEMGKSNQNKMELGGLTMEDPDPYPNKEKMATMLKQGTLTSPKAALEQDVAQQASDRIKPEFRGLSNAETYQKYDDYQYEMGAKGDSNKIDCSGLICDLAEPLGIKYRWPRVSELVKNADKIGLKLDENGAIPRDEEGNPVISVGGAAQFAVSSNALDNKYTSYKDLLKDKDKLKHRDLLFQADPKSGDIYHVTMVDRSNPDAIKLVEMTSDNPNKGIYVNDLEKRVSQFRGGNAIFYHGSFPKESKEKMEYAQKVKNIKELKENLAAKRDANKKEYGGDLKQMVNGGELLSSIGQAAGMVDPITGAAIQVGAMIVGKAQQDGQEWIEKNTRNLQLDKNPYMRTGGNLPNDFTQFNAPSHEMGGMSIDAEGNQTQQNAVAEIEKQENMYPVKDASGNRSEYVFSDALENPFEPDKTMATTAKKTAKKYSKADTIKDEKDALDFELTKLSKLNDIMKQAAEAALGETEGMAYGGTVKKMSRGGLPFINPKEFLNSENFGTLNINQHKAGLNNNPSDPLVGPRLPPGFDKADNLVGPRTPSNFMNKNSIMSPDKGMPLSSVNSMNPSLVDNFIPGLLEGQDNEYLSRLKVPTMHNMPISTADKNNPRHFGYRQNVADNIGQMHVDNRGGNNTPFDSRYMPAIASAMNILSGVEYQPSRTPARDSSLDNMSSYVDFESPAARQAAVASNSARTRRSVNVAGAMDANIQGNMTKAISDAQVGAQTMQNQMYSTQGQFNQQYNNVAAQMEMQADQFNAANRNAMSTGIKEFADNMFEIGQDKSRREEMNILASTNEAQLESAIKILYPDVQMNAEIRTAFNDFRNKKITTDEFLAIISNNSSVKGVKPEKEGKEDKNN